jgi:hypothetical protein
MTDLHRLPQLLSMIDDVNNQDPTHVPAHEPIHAPTHTPATDSLTIAKEVLYSQRMQYRLKQFAPAANEELQIAAYSQHIKRWASLRSDYPEGRAGYKRWRTELGKFHADTTAELMGQLNYPEENIERVKYLLQKKGLKRDEDTQALEDVICLVFLEYYLDAFAAKHEEDKVVSIIQKTWKKMSDDGHKAALSLSLESHLLALVTKALE